MHGWSCTRGSRITYTIKGKKTRTLRFAKEGTAPETGKLTPAKDAAADIAVAPGLSKTTGTMAAPRGAVRPVSLTGSDGMA